MKKVTSRTRAGKSGRQIYCPHCNHRIGISHFSWATLLCDSCKEKVPKEEWLIEETAAELLGRSGGAVKSEAKTKAARTNAKKPRGIWVTAIAFEFVDGDEKTHFGTLLHRGRVPSGDDMFDWVIKLIEKEPAYTSCEVVEITELAMKSERFKH